MRKSKIVAVTVENRTNRMHVGIPITFQGLLKDCLGVEISEGRNGAIVLTPVRAGGYHD
jgi:hypothetical protein